MSEDNKSLRTVNLVIESKGLEDSIHALLTKKYGAVEHISLPPLKFKAVFNSKETADQARNLATPLKVSATCQLTLGTKKKRVVHFPSPWNLKDILGDKWQELALEISKAFESLPGGRPISVRPSMGNIVLVYGTDEDRIKLLTASLNEEFSVTIRDATIKKIHAGYPVKSMDKREEKKKRKNELRNQRKERKKAQEAKNKTETKKTKPSKKSEAESSKKSNKTDETSAKKNDKKKKRDKNQKSENVEAEVTSTNQSNNGLVAPTQKKKKRKTAEAATQNDNSDVPKSVKKKSKKNQQKN